MNHHTLATLGTLYEKNTNHTLCVEIKANNSIVMIAHLKKQRMFVLIKNIFVQEDV